MTDPNFCFHCEEDMPESRGRGEDGALCDGCEESAAERAYESFLSEFYGGSGPVTDRERQLADHDLKRSLK